MVAFIWKKQKTDSDDSRSRAKIAKKDADLCRATGTGEMLHAAVKAPQNVLWNVALRIQLKDSVFKSLKICLWVS